MAHTLGYYSNPVTNQKAEAPVGFSWTMLFFGCFVPLFRGDWMWFVITLFIAFLTGGLSWLVFPFFYNDLYIKTLVRDGYELGESAAI